MTRDGEQAEPLTVALYCPQRELAQLCLPSVPAHVTIRRAHTWAAFEQLAAGVPCAVAVIPWLRRGNAFRALTSYKLRRSLLPVVLATTRDADNARELKSIIVEEVIWLRELDTGLWAAIRRALADGFLRRVEAQIQANRALPQTLRHALSVACLSPQPVRTVGELAALVGQDQSTLWYHWRRFAGEASTLRLKDVLDWLLLLRAISKLSAGSSVGRVAVALDIREDTLRQLFVRLTGQTPSRVRRVPQEHLLERFRGEVLALVGERRPSSTFTGEVQQIRVAEIDVAG